MKKLLLFGVLVTILGLISSCWPTEGLALADVAARLGIEPSLYGLGKYIDSRIKIGMPYEQVHGELEKIGPYESGQKHGPWPPKYRYCEEVVFRFRLNVFLHLVLCYDYDMKLSHWEVIDIGPLPSPRPSH